MPNSIGRIAVETFESCVSLREVVVGNSVVKVENHAFENCVNLEKVTFMNKDTRIMQFTFDRCNNFTIYGGSGGEIQKCAEKFEIPFVEIDIDKPTESEDSHEQENLPLKGKVFAVAGRLKLFGSKSNIKKIIEQHGGKLLGQLSGNADYIIVGEGDKDWRIYSDFKNIPQISENEFEKMIKN